MTAKAENSKNALMFVLITVMINSIGFGIMIPVLPNLIKELTGLENSQAVWHSGYLTLTFAFLQFICMPIVGGLSDRFGRRPIMLFSLAGLALDYFIIALAPTIIWLYLGRAFSGIFGATFSTANAYVADVSPPEKRAQNFGLIGASFGVGFLLGPVIGGILGEYGTRIPFYAAGVISIINVIYGVFFLPETLAKSKRRPFSLQRSNPIGSLISLGRIKGVKSLIFVLFVLATAHTVYPTTYTFSTMEGLGWTPEDVGFSLGAFAVIHRHRLSCYWIYHDGQRKCRVGNICRWTLRSARRIIRPGPDKYDEQPCLGERARRVARRDWGGARPCPYGGSTGDDRDFLYLWRYGQSVGAADARFP